MLLATAFAVSASIPPACAAAEALLAVNQPWTGDFDGMEQRLKVRVLMPYSKTHYFLDGATQRGVAYEGLMLFEKWLNEKRGKGSRKIRVVILPTPRNRLLSDLVKGRGDLAVGNLTITPERLETVDFSDPFAKGVKEIVVAGPDAAPLQTVDDLAGREVYVRPSSSYYSSLQRLNDRFKTEGKEPVELMEVDDYLEDEDLMEMASAGLIPLLVVDEHKANLWVTIFKNLRTYPDIALRAEGEIGWAFRKNSPKLKQTVNRFVAGHKQGSMLFNMLTKRYLKENKWVRNAAATEELKRFQAAADYLKAYAERYGFDWLMVAALAYQESRIDQNLRSPAGAVGVMQVLPATAGDPNVGVPGIEKLENNIHAGVKYLRFLRDRYFEGEPMDDTNKTLFTMASYNAGPARIAGLREEAEKSGLDPNVWFFNVEVIAAKRIGRETVQYVSNIYKYYTVYRILVTEKSRKEAAKKKLGGNSAAKPRGTAEN
jgi:membrane-bound lytic murein transglycosylase MltF